MNIKKATREQVTNKGLSRPSILALAIGLATSPVVMAQSGKSPALALEEVVVTAQKRAESLQDVPVSVDAMSGDQLLKAGFRDVDDVAAQVPSLIVTSNLSPLNASFRIRRIGNEGNIPTFEPDTALIIDGAFRSRSGIGLGELVDVQSVEVLKGPQSTLYGKNAGAGVISINTEAPSSEFLGMGEIGLGSDNLQQFKGYINGALTDAVNGRISFSSTRRDHMIDNLIGPDGDSQDGQAVRVQLSADLTDNWSSRLIIGHMKRDMNTMLGDTWYSPTVVAIADAMAQLGAGHPVTNNDPSDRIIEQVGTNDFEQDSTDAVLHFEYSGDGILFNSITGYEDYESTNIMYGVEQMPSDLWIFNDRQEGSSFSQEFRLMSDTDDNFSWLVGTFYYQNEFSRGDKNTPEFELQSDVDTLGAVVGAATIGTPMPTLFGSPGDTGDVYAQQDSKSFGLFGTVGINLTDDLKVDVGLRYSYDKKDGKVEQHTTTELGCILNNLVCSITPDASDFDDRDSWSAITGNTTLSWYANDTTMLYATYSRGFKAGGYSLQWGNFSEEARPFDEETIQNFELGWKAELWDMRARINGSVFHTEYEDFQNATFVGLAFAVNNAEKVIVDGIELDSTWLLTENLSADINLAYIDAKYDEYTGGQCAYGRTSDNALGQCDLSGENLPFAPKLTGNLALEWNQTLADGDFYARVDYRYTDRANYSSELDSRHEEDAYWVGNFRTGWRNATWDIAAWAKNINDEVYYVQKTASPLASKLDGGASFQAYTGTPRTYGVTVRVNF
ncbi:TonB-dependent receptor [Aestuariicella hydrocarbonica]|uniref:TonB-dependent receptor n=1 Tax=Pseudomaricurvus hydrocarbonicus TaxID=1470433 RepID=A0A9E5JZS9_9GAMM|nr:TonB-dependent receptor [Aestuariicella hydrocarbonica]NHO65717.1 TonB-dependent receptor [Aestuariicella hydrocarbonica]